MLRYVLLAGAAALALPGSSLAQVQWSQPLAGENQASSIMDNPGVLDSPTDYDIPFNQAPTGFNAGDYETAQQDQTRSAEAYIPDASDNTATAQGPQAGNGVYGSQPSGGYYFGSQGDQPLASADQSAAQQGSYGAPPEGAYSGQSYQGYTGEQGAPGAPPTGYVGQGQGSYESPITGQGLGGEGAYQQGQAYGSAPPSQGYTGGRYYEQGPVPSQPSAGPPPSAYGAPPPSQGYTGGGYYTSQPQGPAYSAPSEATANTGQALVVLPAVGLTSSQYVSKTTIANLYEIRAARIALRRSRSPQVQDYARQMLQQNRQGLATITQASIQAGVPVVGPRIDMSHRLQLMRLRRVPARDFDAVYMNQQVVAHMDQAAVQRGYAQSGDNPALQQVATQFNPAVQQNLDVAWNMTGQPQRLAARRSSELALLEQTAGRGQTYRGYTVIGPTSESELTSRSYPTYRGYHYRGYHRGTHYRGYQYRGYSRYGGAGYPGRRLGGYYDEFNYNLKGATPTGVSYQQGGATGGGYQGYTSGAGAQQPGTTGGAGAGIPGTSGYGGPQYQGYTNPSQGVGTTTPGAPPATGAYQGYTPGYTAPGAPPATGAPSYQGYTSPGSPGYTTPSTPGPTRAPPYQGSPGSPGYATPGNPGYTTTPGTAPGLGTTTPGSQNAPNPNYAPPGG